MMLSSDCSTNKTKASTKGDAEQEADEEPELETITYDRRKRSKSDRFPDNLLRETQTVDVPEADRICGCCGEEMPVIDRDVRERLEYIPAKLMVLETVYLKRACGRCRDTVQVAPPPDQRSAKRGRHARFPLWFRRDGSDHSGQVRRSSAAVPAGRRVRTSRGGDSSEYPGRPAGRGRRFTAAVVRTAESLPDRQRCAGAGRHAGASCRTAVCPARCERPACGWRGAVIENERETEKKRQRTRRRIQRSLQRVLLPQLTRAGWSCQVPGPVPRHGRRRCVRRE